MKKQSTLKKLLATTLLTSGLLLSSQSYAISILGTSVDEATKTEQLAQIGIAEKQLEHLFQMLEHVAIGEELASVFGQMTDISRVIEVVMEYEVPEQFTNIHTTMKPEDYDNLRNEAEAYMEEIDAEIKELEWHIALSDSQMDTLTSAAQIAMDPPSDIVASQAQFIGDAARLEQQRREIALRILRDKRESIRDELAMNMGKAQRAAAKCIRSGVCE